MCVCVSIGAWAAKIQGPGNGTYVVSDGVVTFSNTTAGEIAAHFNQLSLSGATQIKFDNTCEIDKNDLECFLKNNTYYVDLFDITNTINGVAPKMQTTAIDAIIRDAVPDMVANNWQAKGIIMPYNSTVGTSEVMDKGTWKNATFSEYAAYYRESETAQNLVLYVFDNQYYNGWGSIAATNYANAVPQLKAHGEIDNAYTVLVSTNSVAEFDLSQLTASKVKIEITGDDMVGDAPNTNVPEKANIYAVCSFPGGFAEHISTAGTKNTPTDLLKISGSVLQSDVQAVNDFTDGPRVLDLRNANVQGGITKTLLQSITNSHIEYILLPEGMSKDIVCGANYSSEMSSLKAVISSSNTNLVAHVAQAGSLAEARTLATGGAYGGYPAVVGLTSVTLSGNLNASDLANQVNQSSKIGSDGHLYSDATFNVTGMPNVVASDTGNGYLPVSSASGVASSALNGEGSISTIDLSDAVFANQYDMNFNLLGLVNGSLQTLKLPTSSEMTILPTGALMGSSGNVIDYLCIPSNFTTIKRYALGNTTVRCLTTDNADHTVVIGANGEQFATDAEAKAACYDTFTLSSNIASVGMGAFLPQSETITDIYVMATTTPKCERDAFSSGMLYGWGGFDGAGAYCREKYKNGTKLFTMLHFPEKGSMTDAAYELMKKNYTDVNKEYTKKDQTGAVDGNGDPIAWPSQNEIYRAYNQASLGLTWNDWPVKKNPEVNTTGDGDDYSATLVPNVTADVSNGTPTGVGDYDFTNYIGWHQFVLAVATYFDQPDIIIENKKTVLQYVEGDWYTLCLPFSLTEAQLIEMLGVPKSEGNTISRIVNQDGTVKEDNVSSRKLPDLRTLRTVTRTPNDPTVGNKNHVRFLLTQDLTMVVEGDFNYWGINVSDPSQSGYSQNGAVEGEKIALRGGYPYLVKPYIRYGETVTNLGKYILTRFASEFETDKLSCKRRDECYEYLNGETETSKFAKPYEKHKIQAMLDVEGSEAYTTHKDGKKYNYAFVGQFWEQDLPRYAFYMVNNNWYRYTSGNKGWKWEPYKCIIMASQETANNTSERAHASSGLYRDDTKSVYPLSTGTDSKGAEIFDEEMEIKFLNGRDDAIFDSSNDSYAKFSFVFDDDIIDVTEDETTGIMKLDGEDIQTVPANGKVYTASGQFVGTSLDGLSKGLYIVNGKKYVVK